MHHEIELADPLNVNEIMTSLPDINSREDLGALSALLNELLARYDNAGDISVAEACAVVRDIGFVMSSIRKLGIQPQTVNTQLSCRMIKLSKLTNMVPRDTVYHYTVWNPEGRYQRLFTAFEDEKNLIKSVRLSVFELEAAIGELLNAIAAGPLHTRFTGHVTLAQAALANSINALAVAIKGVHPRIFSVNLRPYFDPVEIDGISYIASGGGQIPMFLIDKMIWVDKGRSKPLDSYLHFIDECAPYLPPNLRTVLSDNMGSLSLTGLLLDAKKNNMPVSAENETAVKALIKSLVAFRQAHAHYAAKTFTPENRGNYNTGSAGYQMSFVEDLLQLTKTALSDIERN
jgi:monodechloroaminopyrrolnitrin synthase